jgi:hypothetical protein
MQRSGTTRAEDSCFQKNHSQSQGDDLAAAPLPVQDVEKTEVRGDDGPIAGNLAVEAPNQLNRSSDSDASSVVAPIAYDDKDDFPEVSHFFIRQLNLTNHISFREA